MDLKSQLLQIDFKGIVAEYLLDNAFDSLVRSAKKILKEDNQELRKEEKHKKEKEGVNVYYGEYFFQTTEKDIKEQLEHNLKNAFNWSKETSFRDLEQPKSILNTFIELDFYLTPRKYHFKEFREQKKIRLFKAIKNTDQHITILGAPGAGKTTISKFLCLSLILKDENLSLDFNLPIVLRLRDYNHYEQEATDKFNLIDILLSILDIRISVAGGIMHPLKFEKTKLKILSKVIDDLNLLVIIDGFDEIVDENFRKRIVRDLSDLCLSLTESKVILTSRTADFTYRLPNSRIFEISPLNKLQINEFTLKWLGDEKRAKALQLQIYNSPFSDTAIRPLTLAHLCAIFERYSKIPEKPKSVYRKVITLLLEEWDAQRAIERKSKYSNFEIDRKIEFLARIAFELTTRYNKYNFSKEDLEKCYRIFNKEFKLPDNQISIVVNEIESHNGLIIQSGNDSFEFAHKSLQEFLAAEYIKGLDEVPTSKNLLLSIPNELAIATVLSSNQTAFLSKVILDRLGDDAINKSFIVPYLTRLIAEKPDFAVSEKLALSFLFLYSSYLSKSPFNEEFFSKAISVSLGKIESVNTLPTLLTYFLEVDEVKESARKLKDFYKISGHEFLHKNGGSFKHFIVRLNKSLKGSKKHFFPTEMIVRETFRNAFM